MTQTIYQGAAGDDLFDASAEGSKDIAVFRAGDGNDTMLGGEGNDRFSWDNGTDLMEGNGGNDLFFSGMYNTRANGLYDTIDGGSGIDSLTIAASAYQMTNANIAELYRLKLFLDENATTPNGIFVSNILRINMTKVEIAQVRLDGTLTEIATLTSGPITFEDLNHEDTVGYDYHGFNWLAGGVAVMQVYDTTTRDTAAGSLNLGAGSPGHNVIFNRYEYEPIDITRSDGDTFTFLEVLVTSAWNTSQDLIFEGRLNGTLVGQQTVTITDTGPTKVQANWGIIDDLRIHTSGTPTQHVGGASAGNHLAFDNFFLI